MTLPISRRTFLSRSAIASVLATSSSPHALLFAQPGPSAELEFQGIDFHVHLDNSTIDKVLELSRQRRLKFGIVVARFNDFLTRQLLAGALDCFKRHGAKEEDVTVVWVPGSYEIPLVVQQLARGGKVRVARASAAARHTANRPITFARTGGSPQHCPHPGVELR